LGKENTAVEKTSEKNAAPSSQRGRSNLSSTLEKNLSAYALAAGSAGVALLAFAQPADAKVVITKVDIAVPINKGPIQFDINGDGQMDFGLSAFAGPSTCTFTQARVRHPNERPPLGCPFDDQLLVVPAQAANEVWQAGTSYGAKCAADLGRGVRIDRLRPFAAGPLDMYGDAGTSQGFQFCPWKGGTPLKAYLGVKFLDKQGQLHYGWVRVTNSGISATITAYAYETTPNVPILAGESTPAEAAGLLAPTDLAPQTAQPATLGHLALGAAGLAAWRSEEEVVGK
jgi:hypothetical protein